MISAYTKAIEQHGFAIVPQIVLSETVSTLLYQLTTANDTTGIIRRRNSTYGIRNLLCVVPAVRTLTQSLAIRSLVEPILGDEAFIVRGIFFDKTPEANWSVAWHQDLTIAVQKKIDVEGFGPWSVKSGVPHTLAPASVLAQMLTVRLHLDDADETNGALRVMPGSHRYGRLSDDEIETWERKESPVTCAVSKGDALVMRPLLLHASHSSTQPAHRRVIHLEFAAGQLPGGLEWHRA